MINDRQKLFINYQPVFTRIYSHVTIVAQITQVWRNRYSWPTMSIFSANGSARCSCIKVSREISPFLVASAPLLRLRKTTRSGVRHTTLNAMHS